MQISADERRRTVVPDIWSRNGAQRPIYTSLRRTYCGGPSFDIRPSNVPVRCIITILNWLLITVATAVDVSLECSQTGIVFTAKAPASRTGSRGCRTFGFISPTAVVGWSTRLQRTDRFAPSVMHRRPSSRHCCVPSLGTCTHICYGNVSYRNDRTNNEITADVR